MRITIEDLENKRAWDTVQVNANHLNQDQIFSWSNCQFYFLHWSDFWPQPLYDQLIHIPWPKNGCDYAFFIPTYDQFDRELKIIELNTISYIVSVNNVINLRIPHLNTDYTFGFSSKRIVYSLYESIINLIPCFEFHPNTDYQNGPIIMYNTNFN